MEDLEHQYHIVRHYLPAKAASFMVRVITCIFSFSIFTFALLAACMDLDWRDPPVMTTVLALVFLGVAIWSGAGADRIRRHAQALAGVNKR